MMVMALLSLMAKEQHKSGEGIGATRYGAGIVDNKR